MSLPDNNEKSQSRRLRNRPPPLLTRMFPRANKKSTGDI